jgi:hypothetical protein
MTLFADPQTRVPLALPSRREWLLIFVLFVVTRLLVTGVGVVSMRVLSSNEGEQFTHLLDGGPALDMWYRWDAGFYATIATEGYDWFNERQPADDMAFLPLYPLATRAVMALSGCGYSPYLSTCATVSGLIVSNVALFAATVLLFMLVRGWAGATAAWHSVGLLMLSPAGVFLSGVYTEALFLLLTLLVFVALERGRFGWAVAVAILACLTRSVGIALVPALLWTAWRWPDASPAARLGRMALALLPGLVFAAYIFGAGLYVGLPTAYFQTYAGTWERPAGSVLGAFTAYFSGEQVSWFGWQLSWLDLLATLGFGLLGLLVLRQRIAWGLYALAAIAVPVFSGTLVAMPRFGLVVFAVYAWLGRWIAAHRWRQVLVYAAFLALLLLVTSRFVTWRWIA